MPNVHCRISKSQAYTCIQAALRLAAQNRQSYKVECWHVKCDGSDIQGRSLDITQPLGACGCLWKLRIINGFYHHSHLHKNKQVHKVLQSTKHKYTLEAHSKQLYIKTLYIVYIKTSMNAISQLVSGFFAFLPFRPLAFLPAVPGWFAS